VFDSALNYCALLATTSPIATVRLQPWEGK